MELCWIYKIKYCIFSCPSSSIPTLVTHSVTVLIQLQNLDQTIGLKFSFRIWTKPYQVLTIFHNLNQISKFWPKSTILTKFHNFDEKSQFWPIFTILTNFHNFDQFSQYWPNFTIFNKYHFFDQISHYWPNFTILTKFHDIDKIYNFLQTMQTMKKM